jgi:hypothetical protein
VLRGAAAQIAVALPVVFVVRALTQDDTSASNTVLVAVAVALLVAPAVAALFVVAARTAHPTADAALASAIAWAAAAVVTVVRTGLAGSTDELLSNLVRLPFIGLGQVGVAAATASTATLVRRSTAP